MKPITKVFMVIAALVLCLVVWGLFFNDNGVLETAWNAMVEPVNNTWQSITGGTTDLLPEFDTSAGNGSKGLDVDDNLGGD